MAEIPDTFYQNQNVTEDINRLVERGIMKEEYASCIKDTINTMNVDMIANDRTSPAVNRNLSIEERRMFFRILFTIYSKAIERGDGGYVQGENFLIAKLYLMVGNQENREQLLYLIYLNVFIKSSMKILLQPSGSGSATCEPVYPQEKLRPFQFMGWLFLVMVIKKNKDTWSYFINNQGDLLDEEEAYTSYIKKYR